MDFGFSVKVRLKIGMSRAKERRILFTQQDILEVTRQSHSSIVEARNWSSEAPWWCPAEFTPSLHRAYGKVKSTFLSKTDRETGFVKQFADMIRKKLRESIADFESNNPLHFRGHFAKTRLQVFDETTSN
eukprot:IDg3679t1